MQHSTLGLLLTDHTTQKYFESKRDFAFPDAEANIAKTCLTYLSFDRFRKGRGSQEVGPLEGDNPLLRYAGSHWDHHASRIRISRRRLRGTGTSISGVQMLHAPLTSSSALGALKISLECIL